MKKVILKFLSTDKRKQTLYGDGCAISETTIHYPFRGQRIDVKLFGLLWVTYTYYTI